VKAKLHLNLDTLNVETFSPVSGDALIAPWTQPTTGPCLNSEQTCDPACIA
jgi:hypothetical protein